MPTPAQLRIARDEIGVTEATGKNDGTPADRYCDGETGLEWCAAFVVFCFEKAGDPLPGNRWKNRAVRTLAANLSLSKADVTLEDVEPGDILVSERPGGLHVAIVDTVADSWLISIDGNYGNAVKRRRWRRDDARLLGAYRWPPPPSAAVPLSPWKSGKGES